MREHIDRELVSTAAWRLGVSLVLFWTVMLTIAMANKVLPSLHDKAANLITGAIEVGFILIVFSFLFPAAAAALEAAKKRWWTDG